MKSDEKIRRHTICKECTHYRIAPFIGVMLEHCGKCGCLLRSRVMIGCPLKKF